MEEDTIFSMTADASSLDAAMAEIDAALAATGNAAEEMAGVVEEAGAAVEEAMSGAAESTAPLDEALSGLAETAAAADTALAGIGESAAAATAGLGETAGAADAAAASVAGVAPAADEANAGLAGLNLGPLHMVGLAALVAGGAFVKMGADGEDALTRVQALTGATNAQMAQYSTALDQMAGQYGKSVQDLSGGLYDIVSVGINGADALNTLKVAAEAAAAGGVDLHTVTGGLTSIMKAFGVDGAHASTVMDTLLLGVRDGKASFADYSNAIGLVAVTAHGAGFSLNESAAALSTLTAVFPNARRAGMDLNHLLTTIGVNSANVGDQAKKMGLHFDQTKFDTMNLQQRLEYLQKITHGNQAEMLKLTGGTAGFAAAQVLLGNHSKDFSRNLEDMKNKTGATKNAFDIWHHSIGAHAADMVGSLSALAEKFAVLAGPAITGGLDKLAGLFSGLTDALGKLDLHDANTQAVLIVIAGVIGGVLVAALVSAAVAAWTFAAGFIAATWPILLVVGAIALIVAGIVLLRAHWSQIGAWLSGTWNAIVKGVGGFFHWLGDEAGKLWATITGHFQQGTAKAGSAFSALGEIPKKIWERIQQLFWAGVKWVEDLVLGWVNRLGSFFGMLYNHSYLFQHIVDFIRSRFENLHRNILMIWALITGVIFIAWYRIRQFIELAMAFVKTIIQRDWALVERFIIVPVERIVAMVKLRFNEVVTFLSQVWDHIKTDVSDAWNAILSWINSLTGRVHSTVQASVVTPIQNLMNGLGSFMKDAGTHLMQMLIDGINNMVGGVKRAAGNIANGIKSLIGWHSPTDEGPGADSDQWMPALGDMLVAGLHGTIGRVGAEAKAIASAISANIHSAAVSATIGVAASGNAGRLPAPTGIAQLPSPPTAGALYSGASSLGGLGGINPAMLAALIARGVGQGIRQMPLGQAPLPANLGSVSQNFNGGINISGVQNIAQLYAQLAALSGLALEDGLRGASAGSAF